MIFERSEWGYPHDAAIRSVIETVRQRAIEKVVGRIDREMR